MPYTPVHAPEPHTAPASPLLSVLHADHGGHVSHSGHLSHTDRHTGHVSHVRHADRLSSPAPAPSAHPAHPGHPGHPRPSSHVGPSRADHAPGGRPDGVLGNRSVAADSGPSRHGDAHAVTPSPWVAPRLAPGAATRTDRAGARRIHRDVPLFPG
uniref:hypothetical protein n=1 Tax=Streptomyces hawaiiensis TaxID=67305 RepID=UPI0031CFC75D